MPGRPTSRARHARRGVHALKWGANVFFCGCVISALGTLMVAGLTAPSRQASAPVPKEIPVAMIQFTPDRNGMCRHLLFHNDSGRFEERGSVRCDGSIPNEQLLAAIREKRDSAIAQAFKFR